VFPLRQSGAPAAPTSMLELRPRLHSTPQPEKSKQVHRTSFLRITRRDTSSSEEKDYSLWYRHPCTGFRISIYIPPPKKRKDSDSREWLPIVLPRPIPAREL